MHKKILDLKKNHDLLNKVFNCLITIDEVSSRGDDYTNIDSSVYCPAHDNDRTKSAQVRYDKDTGHTYVQCYSKCGKKPIRASNVCTYEGKDVYQYLISYRTEAEILNVINKIESGVITFDSGKVTAEAIESHIKQVAFDMVEPVHLIDELTSSKYIKNTDETEALINIYNKGIPCNTTECRNILKDVLTTRADYETFFVFRMTDDVRLINTKNTLRELLTYSYICKFNAGSSESIGRLDIFTNVNNMFYMIPIKTTKSRIVGFIFRSVLSGSSCRYTLISPKYKEPEYYIRVQQGWDAFANYKYNLPIILVEGIKDAIYLRSKLYPFVLSNNTSSMGNSSEILKQLSTRFILAYDRDKAGIDGMDSDWKKLIDCRVDKFILPKGFKDFASFAVKYTNGTDEEDNREYQEKETLKRLRTTIIRSHQDTMYYKGDSEHVNVKDYLKN